MDRTGQWQMLVRGAEMGAYLPAVELVGLCPSGQIWSAAQSSCWMCPAGSFADAMICGGAQRCTACTNKPGDASYTSAGAPGVDHCSWGCNAGHFYFNQACAPCPQQSFRASIGNESCFPCAPGSGTTGTGSGSCEICLSGFAPAKPAGGCEACHTAACATGQYRVPCTTSAQSVCVACTGAVPAGAVYSGPGEPYDTDACPWACDEGRERSGESCLLPATTAPDVASTTPTPTATAPDVQVQATTGGGNEAVVGVAVAAAVVLVFGGVVFVRVLRRKKREDSKGVGARLNSGWRSVFRTQKGRVADSGTPGGEEPSASNDRPELERFAPSTQSSKQPSTQTPKPPLLPTLKVCSRRRQRSFKWH